MQCPYCSVYCCNTYTNQSVNQTVIFFSLCSASTITINNCFHYPHLHYPPVTDLYKTLNLICSPVIPMLSSSPFLIYRVRQPSKQISEFRCHHLRPLSSLYFTPSSPSSYKLDSVGYHVRLHVGQ